MGFYLLLERFLRHRSLQYLTSSQTFSHFLRHVKGRLHTLQIFTGRSAFFKIFLFIKFNEKLNKNNIVITV